MRVICCQLNIAWEDKPANFAAVRRILDGAGVPPGSLVVLPEMFATGFSMNVASIADGRPSETEAFMSLLARERGAYVLGGLVAAASGGKGANKAVAFSPEGAVIARYRKIHPFSYAQEDRHYVPGGDVVTFDWRGARVSPFICYDLRFPEVFRAATRRGAQVLVVIANWPATRVEHWVTLLRARAIENQAYVAGVNRCGNDPKLAYPGRSVIVGPRGEVMADAGDGEGVAWADLDFAALESYRREFPVLRDIRYGL
jgi:predicted amidohydrolase